MLNNCGNWPNSSASGARASFSRARASAPSPGFPDFRSAEGIWARYDPFEVAHIDAFRRDPARVWEFYALRLDVLGQAEPNDGHRALAELEEHGWIRAVVTQNVDGLHARAGSREIVEVHGSLREAECVRCGVRVPMADVLESLPLPPCPECGEVLKPGVVMFGELLPAQAIERAQQLAAEAGLLLVVGSSLEVYPVAALPETTLAAGGALAIVNRGSTPWDARAERRPRRRSRRDAARAGGRGRYRRVT